MGATFHMMERGQNMGCQTPICSAKPRALCDFEAATFKWDEVNCEECLEIRRSIDGPQNDRHLDFTPPDTRHAERPGKDGSR